MRFLNPASAAILFLVSTVLALPRPHPQSHSPSLLPRQEDQGISDSGKPLLRNIDLIMQQSDLDEHGNLTPKAQRLRDSNDNGTIFDFDETVCEPKIGIEGEEEVEGNAELKEQIRQLCDLMGERKRPV